MKKFLILFFVLSSLTNLHSQVLDGYDVILIYPSKYQDNSIDKYDLVPIVRDGFLSLGFKLVFVNKNLTDANQKWISDNASRILHVSITHTGHPTWTNTSNFSTISLFNCREELVASYQGKGKGVVARQSWGLSLDSDIRTATRNAASELNRQKYSFDRNQVIKCRELPTNQFTSTDFDVKSEESIRAFLDNKGAEYVEGIWEYQSNDGAQYRLAIIKDKSEYVGIILSTNNSFFTPGEIKFRLEATATPNFATINWTMGNKSETQKTLSEVSNNAAIVFELKGAKVLLYRVYPTLERVSQTKINESNTWAGNGSGIIVSQSGHIITNYHVVENFDEIEVEFKVNGEIDKYKAQLLQADKINDLAILKIVDINFNGVSELPYNFNTRTSDVGTKVYAYGYPMALSIMGKELKVTDGIISSKTGFQGDITTYQITAPIQPGNSGGPLFDDEGNFIGINSSGISKDVADNVAYCIKSTYVLNLIDVLPKSISLPSSNQLESMDLTEQIKRLSEYVVLIKVK